MKKRLYVTVNTVFEQREAARMFQLLNYLSEIGVDAIIAQDFGVLEMASAIKNRTFRIHASTQMNAASASAVNFLSKKDVSRVVLARELSLDEIKAIKETTSSELEVFVHGALCVSVSGICLFSSFMGGKSANRGMCTQACRRKYRADSDEDEGAFYFSPLDLELFTKVPLLAEAGVASLKIEGRMKSADYVGVTVRAYRRLLDALGGSAEAAAEAVAAAMDTGRRILQNDFARGKTLFHFENAALPDAGLAPGQDGGTGINLGTVIKTRGVSPDKMALLRVTKNCLPPASGDSLRLHKRDDSGRTTFKLRAVEERDEGIWITSPEEAAAGDSVYIVQKKSNSRPYKKILPNKLDGYRHAPGRESPAQIQLPPLSKETLKSLPTGFYVGVDNIAALYTVQSLKPVKVIIDINKDTSAALLANNTPFPARDAILSLSPFFPPAEEEALSQSIPSLVEKGYKTFILNNAGHLTLLRNKNLTLVAGPYLYTFNRYSLSFLSASGFSFFVPPLENNRQNLEKTFQGSDRQSAIVPIFSYPALFRIRSDLRGIYGFKSFQDRTGCVFRLSPAAESIVRPERPFSITDKVQFLKTSGFSRFYLDFSGPPLQKKDYKDVMNAVQTGTPLLGVHRFNWKGGFGSTQDK
jgi:putative protease